MYTNLYSIEVSSATHDALQLQAMRQAHLTRILRDTNCACLLKILYRFFNQAIGGSKSYPAASIA